MRGCGGSRTGTVPARRARGLWRFALGGVAGCLLLALGVAPSSAAIVDDSGGAYQIIAPGEAGGLVANGFSTEQGELYNKLTKKGSKVSRGAVEHDFVSEKFGEPHQAGDTEEFTSRAGLEIWIDKNDIPHIFGATRGDVMFGSGWVAAQYRGLLLQLGLGPAFAAALSIPGVNAFELLLNARSFKPSAQAITWVTEQKASLLEAPHTAEGEQVLEDLENWVEGVNGYEQTLPEAQRLSTVTLADAIAGFAFIGSIFGNGGGGEVTNSNFLARLEAKYGSEEGMKIFRDLRETNDPEAPTSASKGFPYDGVPTGPTPGALQIEAGSESPAAVRNAGVAKASHRKASNFLVVGAANTKDGHPLAVMGPQLGYFYPEIVMEVDLHGPGIDADGVVAPISPYVFIGRGRDFAWSLTSASNENTQQFLLKLCNPEEGPVTRESEYYEYEGKCIQMTTFNAGEIGAGNSEPAHEVYFKESVYGPVSGTVLVKGQPYAIANDRADRGREPAGEIAFSRLDSDSVHSPEQFFEAANELETTFNMAYLDSKNIAYISTGRLPILAPGTDPSLPTLGNGEYNWRGFLSLAQHPHEILPSNGVLLSWNNKPAPEWGAASETYSYGPIQRVQMFNGFKKKMTEAKDVDIMNRAATQDLRAVADWPTIKQVLAGGPAPSALAQQAANIVSEWTEHGASLYGVNRPNEPGAAIMDAVWTPMAEAVLGPVLGELLPEFESIEGPNNPPNSGGSSFDGGWYGYVYKDLRSELGLPVAQPYSRHYCGNGSLEACRTSLWAAMQHAVEQLSAAQGSEPLAWRAEEVRIDFPPGLLPKYTMSWTNRSTYQQVIEFTGHVEEE
jgi:acyl-homoserine lactone acylase PvdQ